MIAYLQKETGREKVRDLLVEAYEGTTILFMHNATRAEVYYDSLRTSTQQDATAFLQSFSRLPVRFVTTVDHNFFKAIGFYKTQYKVSFADCFVLATAEIFNATVVTSDRHEFEAVENDGRLRFGWIR